MLISNDSFFALIEESLGRGGEPRFVVHGTSMRPILRNGTDEVTVTRRSPRELKKRDIVLFKFKGKHVLHRYLGCKDGVFFFQGDNVYGHGETCLEDGVVAVVKMVHRKVGGGKYRDIDPRSLLWFLWSRVRWSKAVIKRILHI